MIAIKKSLLKLAAYYGHDVTPAQLDIFAEQISRHLTETELNHAMNLYIDDPQNEFFPRPVSKLIALVKKPVENKDQAQNVLNLIKKAVVNHQSGWVQGYFERYDDMRQPVWSYFNQKQERYESWREAARSEIGDLGLLIVDRLGGWKHVCERFDQEPEGVVVGQLVKNIESIINVAEAGQLSSTPALPEVRGKVLNLVNIKTLNPPNE